MSMKTPTAKTASKPLAKSPLARKSAAGSKASPAKHPASKPAPQKRAVSNVVTLRQLAAELAEHYGMPKNQADELLKHLNEMLVSHLTGGDRLRIGGLGILEVKNRPARMGRHPATGEAIQIKASRKIAFRPTKELKNAI